MWQHKPENFPFRHWWRTEVVAALLRRHVSCVSLTYSCFTKIVEINLLASSFSSLQSSSGNVDQVWTSVRVPGWPGNSTPTVEPLAGYKPTLQTGCLMLLTGQWRQGFGLPLGSVFCFTGEEPLGRINNNGFSSVPLYRRPVLVRLFVLLLGFYDPSNN